MARPKKSLDEIKFSGWDKLDEMIVWGTEDYCAEKLGMDHDTHATRIKERFGLSFSEYKNKRMEGIRYSLRKKQFDVAMQGNVSMLIWLGKQMLGQRDSELIDSDNIKEIEVKISKHGK